MLGRRTSASSSATRARGARRDAPAALRSHPRPNVGPGTTPIQSAAFAQRGAPQTFKDEDRAVPDHRRIIVGAGGFGREMGTLLDLMPGIELFGYLDDKKPSDPGPASRMPRA